MRKLSSCLLITCCVICQHSKAQTQSIIYDAVMFMNAQHGVNGLIVPTSNGFLIIDPLTNGVIDMGEEDARPPSTFRSGALAKNIIIEILKRNAGLDASASIDDVKRAYAANPFLRDALATSYPLDSLAVTDKIRKFETDRESGGLGNDILGNLVNGTADFLIKRAQEEISISVFEKLKNFLNHYPELDTLFPKTCAFIKAVEPYEYEKALQALKAAIHEDLENFISRIPLLYDIPRYNVLNKRVPALTLVFAASSLLGELHDKAGFAECVYHFSQQSFLNEQNNYASLLKILAIISNSFLDKKLTDDEDIVRNYIHPDFISSATHHDHLLEKDLARIYLGLIWQHTYMLNFTVSGASKNFGQLLEHWLSKKDISKAITSVNTILDAIITTDKKLAAIKLEDDDMSRATGRSVARTKRFTLYAELVSDLLRLSDLYIDSANVTLVNRIGAIREYLPGFTNQVMIIIRDFHQEEYSLGISDFAALLKTVSDYLDAAQANNTTANELILGFENALAASESLLNAEKDRLEALIRSLPLSTTTSAEANANIIAERQELLTKKEKVEVALVNINYQKANKKSIVFKLSKVIEYINLLAAISKAENSAAVESLLESYALPAGSSRVKKASSCNFAVNAYVGGFFGRTKQDGDGFTNTYGLTAPIGLTLSTGFHRAGSLSLFAGIFDIGGIVKYKLDNQGKYQQDISLAGIVSPGVHLVYGFPFFLPFAAGAGCQWISPVTTTTNKIDLKPTFNAFIAVDVPLFNLANSPAKKKF